MKTSKKVIVLGSGNSGSGAIYDYLVGREDVYKPLDKEFRLIQDPGGLADLYKSYSDGSGPERISAAINDFIDFSNRCGRSNRLYGNVINARYGNGYKLLLEKYYDKVNSFIASISKRLDDDENSSGFLRLISQFRQRLNGKQLDQGLFIPIVDEAGFIREAEIFLDDLLVPQSVKETQNMNAIAIDQGGSFWSPQCSTKFYGENRKVVVVSRDPRGVFNSFKTKGQAYPGNDIRLFCNWYKAVMKHINYEEWKSDKVLHISYESFVLNFESEKKRLDQFLEIDPKLSTSADMARSAYNARKFEKLLSKSEKDFIQTELNEFITEN